jgi:hypothetical protein
VVRLLKENNDARRKLREKCPGIEKIHLALFNS